jgi:heptosyltransferase III
MLVLRPGALGDTLLAVPAVRALRHRYAPITLAAHGETARLLVQLGEADSALAFDDARITRLLTGGPAGEPVVAWAAGVDLKEAVVVAPSRPSDETHCAEYLLRTLAPLGVSPVFDDRPLAVQPIASGEVLVHPGSGSARKNWPAERFAELVAQLPAVRLIVGEADTAVADSVEACIGRQLPRLQGVGVHELAQRLAGCRAYVGNDSGVSHLAGLCGVRSFVLFGPTSPRVWQPLGPHVVVRMFDTEPRALAGEVSG